MPAETRKRKTSSSVITAAAEEATAEADTAAHSTKPTKLKNAEMKVKKSTEDKKAKRAKKDGGEKAVVEKKKVKKVKSSKSFDGEDSVEATPDNQGSSTKKVKREKRKASVILPDDEVVAASGTTGAPTRSKKSKAGGGVDGTAQPAQATDIELADGQTVLAPPSRAAKREAKVKRSKKAALRADGKLPCREFDENGECKFGDKCKFSHLGVGAVAVSKQTTRKKRQAACLAFAEGTCKWGDKCRYRHITAEDDPVAQAKLQEDREIALALQGGDTQEEKLKRIMALPEGVRQKARAIFFAKQRTTGFAAPKHFRGGDPATGGDTKNAAVGKGVCYAFLRGSCLRGDSCIFRHGDSETSTDSKAKWLAYREAKRTSDAQAKDSDTT